MFDSKNDMSFGDLPQEVKSETKYLSKIFLWFIVSYFAASAVLVFITAFISSFDFLHKTENFLNLAVSQLMMPLMYILLNLFTRKQNPSRHPVMDTMNLFSFLKILVIAVFILAAGSLVASYSVSIVSLIKGSAPKNYVLQTVEELSLLEILIFVVILAPIFEELIFRKFVIDKFSKYGTGFSVFMSAFMFGIIHGNLYQFFYAFGLGALMGYVYCTYGKIIYPIIIHVVINTIGSIVPITVGITEAANFTPFQIVYLVIYISVVVCGGILFFKNFKKTKQFSVSGVLISPSKMLFASWGFILFVVIFGITLVYNTLV